jgi:hypothetical protein
MMAARFPHKVNAWCWPVRPSMPAGDGPLKQMVDRTPIRFYEDLVRTGGGLMRGSFMLQGWKNMHPDEHYFTEHVDLFQHIDDPIYLAKRETFAAWYETRSTCRAAGISRRSGRSSRTTCWHAASTRPWARRSTPGITCPLYLLAGERDDITTLSRCSTPRTWWVRRRPASPAARGAGRTHRSVHGWAHPGRGLAADRALAVRAAEG